MSLQEKLDTFKAQFESGDPPYNVPREAIALMHRATEELRSSDLADRTLKVGDRAPDFVLPDYLKELYLGFGNDLAKFNGDDSWTLPMPARFVVDREGIIRSADVSPDYTVRSEPAKVVAAVKAL